ncbi:coiled-coil domain-containing protein 152-like [Macrobrachium rosenbergii]|uniref:coiled-coil domain-containing protein 152-like n=1 Tax=Macrobrachium rosenbergii TaxID=79674 RepID=UPI0034D6E9BA
MEQMIKEKSMVRPVSRGMSKDVNKEKDQMIDQLRLEKMNQASMLFSFKKKVQHFVEENIKIKGEMEQHVDNLKERLVTLEDENKEKDQMIDQLRLEEMKQESMLCSFKRKVQYCVEENEKMEREKERQGREMAEEMNNLKRELERLREKNEEKENDIIRGLQHLITRLRT